MSSVVRIEMENLLPLAELVEMELPARVAWLRGPVLGLSQSRFAEALGVSSRTVKGWEHPDLPRGAPRFAHALGMSRLAAGVYPAELFMEAGRLEAALAVEINRKLDLIMAHLGIEDE